MDCRQLMHSPSAKAICEWHNCLCWLDVKQTCWTGMRQIHVELERGFHIAPPDFCARQAAPQDQRGRTWSFFSMPTTGSMEFHAREPSTPDQRFAGLGAFAGSSTIASLSVGIGLGRRAGSRRSSDPATTSRAAQFLCAGHQSCRPSADAEPKSDQGSACPGRRRTTSKPAFPGATSCLAR